MGVDMRAFKYKERTITETEPLKVLTIGRLVEKKGIEYVIRALANVEPFGRTIEYHIVGDGPLRGYLKDLADRVCPDKRVIFHGSCSSDEVRRQLNQAHLFVLASVTAANGDREGQPVSLIEAQACGLPILSTMHAGIPEAVIHGESGFLVPERDVAALADRLRFLIVNSDKWQAMGRSGRKHVENEFSLDKCTDVITSLYNQIIRQ